MWLMKQTNGSLCLLVKVWTSLGSTIFTCSTRARLCEVVKGSPVSTALCTIHGILFPWTSWFWLLLFVLKLWWPFDFEGDPPCIPLQRDVGTKPDKVGALLSSWFEFMESCKDCIMYSQKVSWSSRRNLFCLWSLESTIIVLGFQHTSTEASGLLAPPPIISYKGRH
jgi:hypothetical protein